MSTSLGFWDLKLRDVFRENPTLELCPVIAGNKMLESLGVVLNDAELSEFHNDLGPSFQKFIGQAAGTVHELAAQSLAEALND